MGEEQSTSSEGKRHRRIGQLFIEAGLIDEKTLDDALAVQKVQDKRLGEILADMGLIDDTQIAQALSRQLDIPFADIAERSLAPDVLALVPERLALKHTLVPLRRLKNALVVAMADPLAPNAIDDLRFATHLPIRAVVAPAGEVRRVLAKAYPKQDLATDLDADLGGLPDMEVTVPSPEDELVEKDLLSMSGLAPVVRFTNAILADAIRSRASDIHLEPQAETPGLIVRCRVDGIMREVFRTQRRIHPLLVSRIKVIAGMDISERRKPQDGKAQVRYGRQRYDLRVSTIPTTFGEKATIRILDPAMAEKKPQDIGLSDTDLRHLLEAIGRPQGIVLVTGPTGSGKTSTLYACLRHLNTPDVNIITVEDPVEYSVAGLAQVQINHRAGIGFADGLRAILRQDPDIVMVGEIRDGETAQTAFRAAQTGHLVISTLHTNDAPAAVIRLIDLGVEAFTIATALNLVIGQRLVRMIHEGCKVAAPPDKAQLEALRLTSPQAPRQFWQGKGCAACHHSGYSGRLGVFELLRITPTLRRHIVPGVTPTALVAVAAGEGYRTMLADGLDKALQGRTTLAEVLRVTPPEPVAEAPAAGAVQDQAEHRRSEPPAFQQEPAEAGGQRLRPKILVAEDNAVTRRMITRLLADKAFRVVETQDGEEALEMVFREKPDLVVSDYMMPRRDGPALIQALRADPRSRRLPILMLTANDNVDDEVGAIEAGADDYLTKPVNSRRFLSRVEKLLRLARRMDENGCACRPPGNDGEAVAQEPATAIQNPFEER